MKILGISLLFVLSIGLTIQSTQLFGANPQSFAQYLANARRVRSEAQQKLANEQTACIPVVEEITPITELNKLHHALFVMNHVIQKFRGFIISAEIPGAPIPMQQPTGEKTYTTRRVSH